MLDETDFKDYEGNGDSLVLELDTRGNYPAIVIYHHDSNEEVNFLRDFGGPQDCFFRWSIFPKIDSVRIFKIAIDDINVIMDNYDTPSKTDDVLDAVDRITNALDAELKTVATGDGDRVPECRCVCMPENSNSPTFCR